jgi:hypothetical protein
MKKQDVSVGETYRVKVSGSVADVRITGVSPHGGWDGVNVTTNRKVRIKSPQRLRGKSPARPGGKRVVTKAEYEAEAKREADIAKAVDAVETGDLAKGVTVPTGAKKAKKAAKDAKPAGKRDTGERAAKGAKRPSGLDAAAQVLADADEPLSVKEIVASMLERKLWQTSGKTPSATIYAAMTREIAAKGDDARFCKVARGKFELAR